jgi:dolichyl-phosphate beta-glucosyltransferase
MRARQVRDLGGWIVRLALVGLVAAIVDLAALVALAEAGVPLALADVAAIAAAATASYGLNRRFTFRNHPYVRWVHRPTIYVAVVVLGCGWDLVTLGAATAFGLALVPAKLVAIASAATLRVGAYWWVLSHGVRQQLHEPSPDRAPSEGGVRLSVVVPAYHEQDRIGATVVRLREALGGVAASGGVEVIVVDDGSADDTASQAREAGADLVVVQPENLGKGAAVRAGVLASRGRTVAFTDADLAYSPDQLLGLLERVEEGWDMVVGSRHHEATTTLVQARRLREVGSRLVNLATMALLLGVYRDTQCGMKAFRGDVARSMFASTRVDGFAFDVELFHLAERLELGVLEIPVVVENSEQSTVKVVRDALRLVRDVLRIRRWDRAGAYAAARPL